MDLNLVVLCGRLASDPEPRVFDDGSRLIRYLVVTKSETPTRRVDVIPIVHWDPSDDLWEEPGERGERVWAVGSMQRRYSETPDIGRSRIEMIAEQVLLKRHVEVST
jgi:single-stranded DNA-binding protein